MFFATTTPVGLRHPLHSAAGRSLERFLTEAQSLSQRPSCSIEQDDSAYTLSFDLPGIAREQLTIGIEGAVVRIETVEGAPRRYKSAYELPQDIDVAASEARLEHGVLTLKLGKLSPASRMTTLTIG